MTMAIAATAAVFYLDLKSRGRPGELSSQIQGGGRLSHQSQGGVSPKTLATLRSLSQLWRFVTSCLTAENAYVCYCTRRDASTLVVAIE